ncbi:MAG: metallophosphoesterase, partial [Deltaproteobacteria bacterium]|nr:metallophosphoesterase [Deltaproteobacteria bacterium]
MNTKKILLKKKKAKNKKFSFAVISDLHAYDPAKLEYKDNPPSYFTINESASTPNHPISDLFELIDKIELEADFLLCAGDIGHQAHPNHIVSAWETIQKVGKKLKCRKIIATSGNHDIDSRYNHNNFDAKGLLLSLNPPFPLSADDENNKYWARNYTII